MSNWIDSQKGIEVKSTGYNEARISYNGLLAHSGADQVYLHIGSGDPRNWQHTRTEPMQRTTSGFEKTIHMDNQVNFCFKDSANNWDNNCGLNWSIR
ncbi:carbohydrate-binding protein [Heliophilum fasciatum]|uniref:Putative carbohydrate-binding protein with starch-binding CBM53 n=1 Tax=Heliophilum fasciatum TaxID=35700 RepID=A0A4R2RDX9_9FIRM|nr:carbohydrate-binding protein [Heliophilum fasciatum]MCW2279371.1 hypothetical protein [Heliophilum fasciatum]TCP60197.1 putative carbohydrate-binding protein with starch-binding CBM53 [Heliophilum fasciatum]